MPNYRCAWVPGGTCFFTVNVPERRRRLLVDEVVRLRRAFRRTRERLPFEVLAMVVLPDPLHCIGRLPPEVCDNGARWSMIKGEVARGLPADERRSSRRVRRRERGIWQRRYWERPIRDDGDLRRHIDYSHYNPVKHDYVDRVAEWPYSSFHRYLRLAMLPLDWTVRALRR